jgi:fructose-bisphosphate aldolase class II
MENNSAVGAFNFSNMEVLQAIVEAANEEKSPCIIQVTESAIKYMGMEYVRHMVMAAVETSVVPLCLHLDHGKDFGICALCVDNGFSSVMIDKSSLPFDENIEHTKRVVEYAHSMGVSVEAELGVLSGVEDNIEVAEGNSLLTDPNSASVFVQETGIDSLAVAIGTTHGAYKCKNGETPKLDVQRLIEIRRKIGTDFPLVLHGASSVYSDIVQGCNKFGAKIERAVGIADRDIKAAIENGVAKINVDTDIRLSFLLGILEHVHMNPTNIDSRKYMGHAKELAKSVIKRKISMLSNKAAL